LKNEYDMLMRDKLSALHRTLLRDRMNSLALVSGMLPYNNAPATMYHYLKDVLGETAWRPSVHKLWSHLRVQDHWRMAVEETQRVIGLSEELMDETILNPAGSAGEADLVAIAQECADAINQEQGVQQVRIRAEQPRILVAGNPAAMQGTMQRLMEPMSRWAATGSTLQVNLSQDAQHGDDAVAKIHFEARNCEPVKAMQDCALFTPALQVVPKRASDYLKATLAVGHMGGSISSPPMENGYKQVDVTLPKQPGNDGKKVGAVPKQWLQDLSDEYEKWVLGTLETVS
jgi:two-component system probable response regulator PhcQ